jgi:DNA-binding transcriptional regulator YhcF (GntR family)
MIIEIDFNSDEAIYVQLCNQIILGIATSQFREGEQLPSVRQLADTIGINMHTVNKAYAVLRDEGYVVMRGRSGAVIADTARSMSSALAQERRDEAIRDPEYANGRYLEEIHFKRLLADVGVQL